MVNAFKCRSKWISIYTNRIENLCDDCLNCFDLQKIAEQKLQAFAIGAMGQRPLSRREQEERRKREEEQAAASVCTTKHQNIYILLIASI